jgi:serine/threonine protein kinase
MGRHLLTGQQVAIKIVDKIHAPTVIREINTWRHLTQHPHIARLYEVLTSENKIYMVMELAEGGELFEYVTQKGKLDEHEARRIFKQLASAILYCHQNNFVHRFKL